MEKNKRSFLDKILKVKKVGDGTLPGKECIPCGAINAEGAKFCFACGSAFSVIYDKYDAFISYRREPASDLASLVKVQLENNFHKRIFIDVKELQEGRFDEALLNRIEETPNFILILSKSSLDNCKEKSDWLKREIVHAIATRRNIITVLMKGFTFPADDLWELLPKQMRVLSSLNGIHYDHIHQDADIRKIASYMKSEKEVPPVKPGLVEEEQEPPPPSGGGTTKPGPDQSGSSSPGQPSTGPVSTRQNSGVDTTPGHTKPLQVPPSRSTDPPGQHNTQYFPVTGVLVKDSTGTETILTEFGVRVDSGGPRLEDSNRDDIIIAQGQGQRQISWGQIESIEVLQREDATIKLSDGTSLDHAKLHPKRLVGKTPEDYSFSFEFNNYLTITTLRDSTLRGPEELIRDIPILAKRAIPQAHRWTLTIQPEGEGVAVTADNYFYNDLKNTHTFMMPGPHKFSAHGKFVKFTVSPTAGENFTMELFPVETAIALAMALTRLNSLLLENKSSDEKKETPESANPDVWFMKTTEGPGQRSNFGMVYDDKQEVIILHGGFGKGNTGNRHYGMPVLSSMSPELHDTWTWDGSSWRLLSKSPLSLVSHAMAYDKKTQQNIISGGWTGIQRLQDTHILTGDKWIKAENGIEFYKGGFSNHAMAYDEKRKTIILFGGLTVMFGRTITLGDTWEWNGSAWSKINVNGPGPRWGHTMVYDQSIGAIVLFGGNNGTTYFDDTWIWEGNSASWSKLSPKTNPSARSNHGMLYDSLRKSVIMFGGLSADKLPLNDLWEWNGSDWVLLTEHAQPKPRYDHGFAYDTKRNKSVLFGGTDGKQYFQDTWELGE